MKYFVIEPEVPGDWGENTIVDPSTHPPVVHKFHFHLTSWNGIDSLLESFPCFMVTDDLAKALQEASMTGYELDDVEVTVDEVYRGQFPDRIIPMFRWLKVNGRCGTDDFSLNSKHMLLISERALSIVQSFGLQHADLIDSQARTELDS